MEEKTGSENSHRERKRERYRIHSVCGISGKQKSVFLLTLGALFSCICLAVYPSFSQSTLPASLHHPVLHLSFRSLVPFLPLLINTASTPSHTLDGPACVVLPSSSLAINPTLALPSSFLSLWTHISNTPNWRAEWSLICMMLPN